MVFSVKQNLYILLIPKIGGACVCIIIWLFVSVSGKAKLFRIEFVGIIKGFA